jgi:Zn-dependent alcohol dehydrogenase
MKKQESTTASLVAVCLSEPARKHLSAPADDGYLCFSLGNATYRPARRRLARVAGGSGKAPLLRDTVGVGCLVDSCQHCASCEEGLEQFCENGKTLTYNSPVEDKPGHTLGGYSQRIVVNDKFVLRISHPEEQLAAVAPLLCAGITTYSPLRHWKVGPGMKVGIVGIGGLGHMGVKLAHAMGAHTVAFTISDRKRGDALDLGADEVIVSRNAEEMEKHVGSFDFILCAERGIVAEVEMIPVQKIDNATPAA